MASCNALRKVNTNQKTSVMGWGFGEYSCHNLLHTQRASSFTGIIYMRSVIEHDTFDSKVTRGNSGHGVFPVTRKKIAHCSKIPGFLVQLQRCASSVKT